MIDASKNASGGQLFEKSWTKNVSIVALFSLSPAGLRKKRATDSLSPKHMTHQYL